MQAGTFREIIELAIGNETEAFDFYSGVANRIADANLRSIFENLAAAEKGHRETLKKILQDEAYHVKFSSREDYKVAESIESPALTLDMRPVDAIALAVKKEQEAMETYRHYASLTEDAEARELFVSLSKMEQSHKATLEDLYTNMAFPEAW